MSSSDNVDVLVNDAQRLRGEIQNASSKDEALQKALRSAELSMQALKLSKDATAKKQLSTQVNELLSEAERIKANGKWRTDNVDSQSNPPLETAKPKPLRSIKLVDPVVTREPTNTEKIILLKGSILNGSKFPPWQRVPSDSDFELQPGACKFLDQPELRLSAAQQELFDGWKRPEEVADTLESATTSASDPDASETPDVDLVQDAATDCSVVASLCAIVARARKGHPKILQNVVCPWDAEHDYPRISANGKYVMRFNFNGTQRRVEIDDRLPISKTSRAIHVIDRKNPRWVWPALLEKAYLKVRGGYDFPGSNSGTDLWVISGWIPEQIFLACEDVSPYDVWTRIQKAHGYGDVLVTLGTGKISSRAEKETGLAGEHDYAVIDLREIDGRKSMLIKNPWARGTGWRSNVTAQHRKSDQEKDKDLPSSVDLLNVNDELTPGTFWMDLNNITQHFESIYLNWNPGLFSYRADLHFSYDLNNNEQQASLLNKPQFAISLKKGDLVWILLSRHFCDIAESTRNDAPRQSFVGVSIHDAQGKKVVFQDNAIARSQLVDSPQVLLRADGLLPDRTYTVSMTQDRLPPALHAFTISAFANSVVTLGNARDRFPHRTVAPGAWTQLTSGGNTTSPIYSQNPQFSLSLPTPTSLMLMLQSDNQEVPIHVKLIHGQGKRVHSIRSRDIIIDSKDHRRGCAVAEIANLDAGKYTVICSTFEAGQMDTFDLRVDSMAKVQLLPLPREGAGLIRTELPRARFQGEEICRAIQMTPRRLTKLTCVIKNAGASLSMSSDRQPKQQQRSMIRATVELGEGMDRHVLSRSAANGDYVDSSTGVRTKEVDVYPGMIAAAGLWLIIERHRPLGDRSEDSFSVEMFTDAPQTVSTGEWREWEEPI